MHANPEETAVIKVYGELVSAKYGDPVVLAADGVFDYLHDGKSQEQLNDDQIPTVGSIEPQNNQKTWFNTVNEAQLNPNRDTAIETLTAIVNELRTNQTKLLKLIQFGVIAGDASTSVRTDVLVEQSENGGDIINPDESGEEEQLEKPDVTDYDHTVPAIVVKCDTTLNFKENMQNLTDGELLFFTDSVESRRGLAVYYGGKFYKGSSSSGSGSSDGDGLTIDDLYALVLEYLNFTDGAKNYKIAVDKSGNLSAKEYDKTRTVAGSKLATWNVYISPYLNISSVYCGGDGADDALVSHNFVELHNGDSKDINLNGLLLLYTDCTKANNEDVGYAWKVLKLNGIIKAGSTFLIRGAQCNTEKRSLIKVSNYDMEWYDGRNLIKFSQERVCFYLAVADSINDSWVDDKDGVLMGLNELSSPWASGNTNVKVGYIDSCGFGTNAPHEGTNLIVPNKPWKNLLFTRWFYLETAKQGVKAYNARVSKDLWTYIDLEKQTEKLGNSTQYYYPDWMKQLNTPKDSHSGKNFFSNKTKFNERQPNCINVTLGIQATATPIYYTDEECISFNASLPGAKTIDDWKIEPVEDIGGTVITEGVKYTAEETIDYNAGLEGAVTINDIRTYIHASRCFNWVSVGYYEEYIEYKKITDSSWTRVYSITANNSANSIAINKFIDHYQRLRWCSAGGQWVTTHKVILSNVLTPGNYQYRIGRDNDIAYTSGIRTFTVRASSDVTSFKFIQTTDQQAFNWQEYQAWKRAADMIKSTESGYDFFVNTGDMTQSGNRENEWLDYWDAEESLHDKEVMFTIGNNDLCGYDTSKLTDGEDFRSKFNHINVLRYFTFELDPDLDYTYTWNGNDYPFYSLYSFNYGQYHFICLNSEIAEASSKTYVDGNNDQNSGDPTMASIANAKMEDWLLTDLQKWSGQQNPTGCSKCFVYMHEMPFTMVTFGFMNGKSGRVGSHLNILNNNGLYRFSRLFKKYGIKVVFGGHKHTYTLSKPIYDAPENYINENHTVNGDIDLMGEVDNNLSRKPVIQVTNVDQIPAITDAKDNFNNFARYEIVDTITAPTYIMCQATGYKLVSNKEQPSGPDYTIPWLLSYFKAITNASSPTENVKQHKPMYIVYDVNDSTVKVTAKQVENIWVVDELNNEKTYDFNQQATELSVTPMTCTTTTEEDKVIYNINDVQSYNINI